MTKIIYRSFQRRRLWLIQGGILATFALIPVWYRLPQTPVFFANHYFTRFLLLLPMVWSIGWWLIAGLPGFAQLRRDRTRAWWALALLALAVWAYASTGWAFIRFAHPEVAMNAALQCAVVALFTIVVASAGPPARAIVGVLVFGLIWNSVLVGLQSANQRAIGLGFLGEFNYTVKLLDVSVVQAEGQRWVRPYGLLPNPNPLGGFFAVGLLAAASWTLARSFGLRWIGTIIFVAGFWAFLLTFSRAAWIGFAAGAFALYPLLRRTQLKGQAVRRQVWITLGLTLTAVVAFLFIYQPFLLSRAGVGEESIELRSVSDRLVFNEFAFRSITERPLQGVGMGNFPWRASYYLMATNYDLRGNYVHHVLLSVWADLGMVGYGLVAAAMILGVEAALRNVPRANSLPVKEEPTARIVLLGGFLALTVIGLFDYYPWALIQFQTAWWGLLAAAMREDAVPDAQLSGPEDPRTAPSVDDS